MEGRRGELGMEEVEGEGRGGKGRSSVDSNEVSRDKGSRDQGLEGEMRVAGDEACLDLRADISYI